MCGFLLSNSPLAKAVRSIDEMNIVESVKIIDTNNKIVVVTFTRVATWDVIRKPINCGLDNFMLTEDYETIGSKRVKYNFNHTDKE